MIRIHEGELASLELVAGDVAHLKRILGRDTEVAPTHLLVRRKAGIWVLPSGQTLCVEPRKGTGADVFAWMCAVDPRLIGHMHEASTEGARAGGVAEVAIRVFCSTLMGILRRNGLRQQYRRKPEACSSIRGRVDWAAYAREPLPARVPCVFWQRDLDAPLNRMLAAVLRVALLHESLRRAGGRELSYLTDMFGHVPAQCPESMLDLSHPLPRAEADYEGLRRLAVILLEGAGLAHGGAVPALGFEVDLARLFERSVERSLLLTSWSTPPQFQMRPPYEGENGDEWSAIDALVSEGSEPIVVDAKYAARFSKGHLYQVLAYMKMVDARRGVLVYPTGAELASRLYRGTGGSAWEVRVLEVDPVQIGRDGGAELRRLGTNVKECCRLRAEA